MSCLLLSTETYFQIWILKDPRLIDLPALSKKEEQMECLYCRLIPEVANIDFIHISQSLTSNDQHARTEIECLSKLEPLIGYVTYEDKSQLNIYSLVKEKTISVISTTAPVHKFVSHLSNPACKLSILLLDGSLMIVDLLSMEVES